MNQDLTYTLRKYPELFSAALQEFSTYAYNQASVNEIIKHSEMNKGSFYYRFKTKEEIYTALIDYVYVIQIDLFKQLKIDLYSLNDIKKILQILFQNINQLTILEPRYYMLLQRISNESSDLQETIKQLAIEPLFIRIKQQLKHLFDSTGYQIDQTLFFHTLGLLYYNVPYPLNLPLSENQIERIISILLQTPKVKYKSETKAFFLPEFSSSLTFLLSDSTELRGRNNTLFISELLSDEIALLHEIRQTMKIRKVDISSVVTEGIKRNLKDYRFLRPLRNLPFAKQSYHLLDDWQKVVLAMVYKQLLGQEEMVIDHQLRFAKFHNLSLLFTEILPLLVKTCRIVVIERRLPLLVELTNHMYYMTVDNQILPVSLDHVIIDKKNSFHIQYINRRGDVINKIILKDKFKLSDYKDKIHLHIAENDMIDINQVRGGVGQ